MTSLNIFTQIATPFSAYSFSNLTVAYVKDGQQTLTVAGLASSRFSQLNEISKVLCPQLTLNYSTYFILAPALLFTLATPYAKAYLNPPANQPPRPDNLKTACLTVLCKAIEKGNNIADTIYSHSDIVLNTASCVAYVAMIVMGMPIGGVLGLATLALLAVKRYQHLPENLQWLPGTLDRIMDPLAIVANFTLPFTMSLSLLELTLFVALNLSFLFQYVSNNRWIIAHTPEWMLHPLPGRHITSPVDWQQFERSTGLIRNSFLLNDYSPFGVNSSYIYAREVGELFPENITATARELFDQLGARIEQGVKLTDVQERGLRKLCQAAVHGRIDDVMPPNLEKLQEAIRACVQSILQDPEPRDKIVALADVGNSCMEGWTRDITYMLNPRTADIRWQVHFLLSKMRGEILKEEVGVAVRKLQAERGLRYEQVVGGSNNIHLNNVIQSFWWINFRTYEAELVNQINPHSILGALFVKYIAVGNSDYAANGCRHFLTGQYIGMQFTNYPHFLPIILNLDTSVMNNHFYRRNANVIIDAVYDAIKPQYVVVEGQSEARRQVPWNAVLSWIASISESIDIEERQGPQNKYIERDVWNQPYLTKLGVSALLLDMGILTQDV